MTTETTTSAIMDASITATMPMAMASTNCKISMLWNWNTMDVCFISSSWHITSPSMFAGSCIGVILLVICLELLRRVASEYDAFIINRARLKAQSLDADTDTDTENDQPNIAVPNDHPTDRPVKKPIPWTQSGSLSALPPVPESAEEKEEEEDNEPMPNAPETTSHPSIHPKNQSKFIFRPSKIEQLIRATLHVLQFAVAYFVMLLGMYYNGYIILCIFVGAFVGFLLFSWGGSLSRERVGSITSLLDYAYAVCWYW
ncbi:Ctr copper transporter family protein [Aspergillus eucalypticola CBS 122712]|uniref:Copper transport protein n=1 Tax=Aspergillus eucalypticola (strain CBS 122712 / IBT 29274) TaxID=1448314 RepID=A0A317VZX7_ASPEC|nr:Ctr copper transporter family protein [Aspergillus eucalypticola CBS 122712]PWY79936.1 Ctr copper transporter family protein [Aspergillus eucalypticola CBS 122712]